MLKKYGVGKNMYNEMMSVIHQFLSPEAGLPKDWRTLQERVNSLTPEGPIKPTRDEPGLLVLPLLPQLKRILQSDLARFIKWKPTPREGDHMRSYEDGEMFSSQADHTRYPFQLHLQVLGDEVSVAGWGSGQKVTAIYVAIRNWIDPSIGLDLSNACLVALIDDFHRNQATTKEIGFRDILQGVARELTQLYNREVQFEIPSLKLVVLPWGRMVPTICDYGMTMSLLCKVPQGLHACLHCIRSYLEAGYFRFIPQYPAPDAQERKLASKEHKAAINELGRLRATLEREIGDVATARGERKKAAAEGKVMTTTKTIKDKVKACHYYGPSLFDLLPFRESYRAYCYGYDRLHNSDLGLVGIVHDHLKAYFDLMDPPSLELVGLFNELDWTPFPRAGSKWSGLSGAARRNFALLLPFLLGSILVPDWKKHNRDSRLMLLARKRLPLTLFSGLYLLC
ncbi:hypothetical protein PAPYR_11889 [Paratrimastix pyriformis]|uniref:Uncharacterized protein n=1 Tax=Paratrimastix pyriformis TaxID=342808 RepID=A0ABQ8U6K8_9EUKA|nr:hypothetical protein PAPYR_11889 [Paratrimastix pyriformis]